MQTYGRPANGLAFLYRKTLMPPSSQQAYASLQDFSKNRRSTQDIQNEAESKYNISGISSRLSGMRTLVGNLENSLENVDPSVRGRNSGGFVTEGQNQALINREQQPILGNLTKQQRAYGDTQQEFSLSSALAGDLARSIRSDDETAYQRLLDQYNAASAQEQAAEAKRQFEENARLEREKVNASQRAASTGTGYDISGILQSLGLGGNQPPPASNRPPLSSIFSGGSNSIPLKTTQSKGSTIPLTANVAKPSSSISGVVLARPQQKLVVR